MGIQANIAADSLLISPITKSHDPLYTTVSSAFQVEGFCAVALQHDALLPAILEVGVWFGSIRQSDPVLGGSWVVISRITIITAHIFGHL